MSSKRSAAGSRRLSSGAPTSAASNPFGPPRERDPRTPGHPKWDGRKDELPEPQHLPQFKNYQFRYGAYPGYRDCSKNPQWPDGAVAEHERRQTAPVKHTVGRLGRTTFRRDERVCGNLHPTGKEAHEFMWYSLKDPDHFSLKPPRRWDPAGIQRLAPRPFYNREDGHFLLHNTCTIPRLCMLPELRRLQCYYLPKLPKIRKDRHFSLPMKKQGRQHTLRWRWTESWKRQLIPWYSNSGPEEPEVAEFKAQERLKHDKNHTSRFYYTHRESIETLREWHRKPKVKTPPPPKAKPIDYHVKLGREILNGVRNVEELFEDSVLKSRTEPLVDIVELIKAEQAERKRLAEEAKRENPTPPPPPSICHACDYYGDSSGVIEDMYCSQCAFHSISPRVS